MRAVRGWRRRLGQLSTMLAHPVEQLQLRRALRRARAAGVAAACGRSVPFKYVGDYLAAGFARGDRLAALVHHYELLAATPGAAALWRAPVTLWDRDDEEGRRHAVILQRALLAPMEGEAELVFTLDGERLFTLTFTIVDGAAVGAAAGPLLLIGGAQGRYAARESLRYAARANGEIAPATLLLLAAAVLAERLGMVALAGPSNRTQVAALYVVDGRSSSLDYDAFWTAAGAAATARDFFLLAATPEVEDDAEITGKHRARTRRRRRLRAELRAAMHERLGRAMTGAA